MSNSLEVRLTSITDNEVYIITGNTLRGSILSSNFEWNKIGGLLSFDLTLSRETELPLFAGMRLEFYFRDDVYRTLNNIFTGYVEVIPTSENNVETIILEGKGYSRKFEERILNQDYSATTITDIINSLDYSGLDLDSTQDNVAPPVVNISAIEFKDKTYTQVFNTLVQIANSNINNAEYIWGINEHRGIYFHILPSVNPNVSKKYFEGYHYQSPEIEITDNIINKLIVFRATQADPKQTELVATYEDTDSQDLYGIREQKLTISDYMDTTSIALMASAILENNKEPDKLIKMNNFFIKDTEIISGGIILDDAGTIYDLQLDDSSVLFGCIYRDPLIDDSKYFRTLQADYYGLSNKPQIKQVLVDECDSLDNWTDSTPTSVIVEDNTNVMTGRQAFKWTRSASQPTGDYIELELNTTLNNPISVLFMVYFANNVPNVTFTFYDSEGDTVDVIFTPTDERINTWLKIVQDVTRGEAPDLELLNINNLGPDEALEINNLAETTFLSIGDEPPSIGLRDLVKVRITLGEGTTDTDEIYIDRIQLKNNAWSYSRLVLERAKYNVTRDFILGELEFGNKKMTLVDEIKNKLKSGDIAYDMYTRS